MSLSAAIASADRAVLEGVTALRTGPLTAVMPFASAWWVKSVGIGAAGVVADLVRRPRRWPPTFVPVLLAALAASLVSSALKDLFDRARPPDVDPGLTALVTLPGDGSMPSGHAVTAFAVAGVVAAMHPRLRVPALAAAALVGVSRVYLGVHFPLDVVVGALVGLAVAAAVVGVCGLSARRAAERMRRWRSDPST